MRTAEGHVPRVPSPFQTENLLAVDDMTREQVFQLPCTHRLHLAFLEAAGAPQPAQQLLRSQRAGAQHAGWFVKGGLVRRAGGAVRVIRETCTVADYPAARAFMPATAASGLGAEPGLPACQCPPVKGPSCCRPSRRSGWMQPACVLGVEVQALSMRALSMRSIQATRVPQKNGHQRNATTYSVLLILPI